MAKRLAFPHNPRRGAGNAHLRPSYLHTQTFEGKDRETTENQTVLIPPTDPSVKVWEVHQEDPSVCFCRDALVTRGLSAVSVCPLERSLERTNAPIRLQRFTCPPAAPKTHSSHAFSYLYGALCNTDSFTEMKSK